MSVNPTLIAKVFQERMTTERMAQDAKWGEQNHSPLYWLGILGEEYGEVCKAVIEGDAAGAIQELIQLAAVAQAMYECSMRNNWEREND